MASAGQPSLSKDAIRRYFFPSISCFQVERIAECNRKLVIVGDGACGKTSLLSVFTLGYFPKVRSPPFALKLMTRTTYDCGCKYFRLTCTSNRLCLTITFPYVELTDEKFNLQYG